MPIVYKELINSNINKISSSLKKFKKSVVSVNINGHIIMALYDTGADLCCMTAAKFRQVFPVNKRTKKLNVISTVTVASREKFECMGVYPIPFDKLTRRYLCTTFMYSTNSAAISTWASTSFNMRDSLTILEIRNSFGPRKTGPTGKQPNFNVLPS
jgi:hypothetical protein